MWNKLLLAFKQMLSGDDNRISSVRVMFLYQRFLFSTALAFGYIWFVINFNILALGLSQATLMVIAASLGLDTFLKQKQKSIESKETTEKENPEDK